MLRLIDLGVELLHKLATLVAIPALTLMIVVDVAMRYIFNSPFEWAIEVYEALLLISFFGTLPYVTRKNGHIRMELLYTHFRGLLLRFSNVLWAAAGIFSCLALTWKVATEIPYLIQINAYSYYLGIPSHWLYAFVAFCSGVMGLLFLYILFAGGVIGEANADDEIDVERSAREGH